MTDVNFFEAVEIKQVLKNKFNIYLHFHDACPKQYFSFDEIPNNAVIDFINNYFDKKGMKPVFLKNGLEFYLA